MNHDLRDALERLRKLEEDGKRNIERQLAAFDRTIRGNIVRQMRSEWAVTVLKSMALAVISAAVAVKSIRSRTSN